MTAVKTVSVLPTTSLIPSLSSVNDVVGRHRPIEEVHLVCSLPLSVSSVYLCWGFRTPTMYSRFTTSTELNWLVNYSNQFEIE